MGEKPSAAQRNRWRNEAIELLEDFPRQYAALQNAMVEFGADFPLPPFTAAFDSTTDMDSYNRVQSVERALGRVQNFVAQLSIVGAKLAELQPPKADEDEAGKAFAALHKAGVINAALCRKLRRAQKARTMIEHSYVKVPAGKVHEAAGLIAVSAREFIGPYRAWVEDYL